MTRSTVTPGGEEGQRAVQEGAGALLPLVGQELGVGETEGIVDGDVQDAPSRCPRGAAIAGEAMADAVDAAEFLGVDVDHLAGPSRS